MRASERERETETESETERVREEGVSHVMIEAALVDHVVPGSLPATTRSHDSAESFPAFGLF